MKKTSIFIFTLLICVCSFGQLTSEAEKCIIKGIEYHKKGQYDKAIEEYDKALIFDKDNIFAYSEKAMTLLRQKREREAIKLCEKAIEIHPKHSSLESIYITLGTCYSHLEMPYKAIEKYDEGLKLFPNQYLLHFNKGISYYGLEYYDEALHCFEKALTTNPFHAGSHNAIANIHQMKRNRIPSIMSYCFFLLIEPEGDRAKRNFEQLIYVAKSNVERKDKKNITININSSQIDEIEDGDSIKSNNFSTIDLMLSITDALELSKKSKDKINRESFYKKLKSLSSHLKSSRSENKGFYWEFYAQFFVDMLENEHLEAFSYIAFITTQDKKVVKWLEKNDKKIKSLYEWASNYSWNIAETLHPIDDLEIITRD